MSYSNIKSKSASDKKSRHLLRPGFRCGKKRRIALYGVGVIATILGILALVSYQAPRANAAKMTLENISTMQEMSWSICNNSAIGSTASLTDIRDGNIYNIRKHEDGNCWMTENLRIIDKTLTPADSDVVTDYVIPDSSLASFDIDSKYQSQAYYDGNTTNGAYYNWYTATASTGGESVATDGQVAPSSICPKGWKLPLSNGNGSFANLTEKARITNDVAGVTKIRSTPYSFSPAGATLNSALQFVDASGYYWSRTASSSINVYSLSFTTFGVSPVVAGDRSVGEPVRCVANGINPSASSTLSVIVDDTITIDAVSNMEQVVDSKIVNKGNISATISSSTHYQVLLHSNDPDLRNPELTVENAPTIPAASNLTPGTSAWGIVTGSPDGSSGNSTYVGITTTPQSYYNTTSLGAYPSQTIHTYGIGVTISPLLPSGIYSTSITVTAVGV